MTIKVEKKSETLVPPRFEAPSGFIPDPSRIRQYFLTFDEEVAAGATATIKTQPQLPFRGHRLSVDPEVASSFNVLDIKVGANHHFINYSEGGVKATLFPPLPKNLTKEEREDYEALLKMQMDTAHVSQLVALTVRNTSNKTQRFSGVIWGVVVE